MIVYLIGLVKKEAKICEHHPELLPPITILKFAEQIATQLIYEWSVVVCRAHTTIAMPAHMHGGIGAMLLLLLLLWLFALIGVRIGRERIVVGADSVRRLIAFVVHALYGVEVIVRGAVRFKAVVVLFFVVDHLGFVNRLVKILQPFAFLV